MKIMILDDESELLEIYKYQLTKFEHDVRVFISAQEALLIYMREPGFDLIITDFRMPKVDGASFIVDVRSINPQQKIAVVTGDPSVLIPTRLNVRRFAKPVSMAEVIRACFDDD